MSNGFAGGTNRFGGFNWAPDDDEVNPLDELAAERYDEERGEALADRRTAARILAYVLGADEIDAVLAFVEKADTLHNILSYIMEDNLGAAMQELRDAAEVVTWSEAQREADVPIDMDLWAEEQI